MSNATFKLIVTLLVLVIVIGGGMLLYQKLGQNVDLGEIVPTESISENLATDFTVTDAEGNEVKLSDFRGKGVVLNFWASWCGPCKSEMPDFNEVYQELGEEVQFLMINMTDGDRETVEIASEFVAGQGYTFPVFYDTAQHAAITYGVYSLPTTLFIDAEGYLVAYAPGAIPRESLLQGIDMIR